MKRKSYFRFTSLLILQCFLFSSIFPAYALQQAQDLIQSKRSASRDALRTQPLVSRDGGVHTLRNALQKEPLTLVPSTARDGSVRIGPLTQKVIEAIQEAVGRFDMNQPLTDDEQTELADAFEKVFRETVFPYGDNIIQEIGIEAIIEQKKKEGFKSPTDYPRVVIHLDDQNGKKRFELTIIGYLPGQMNPIHNHGGNVCVFCIVGKGTGKERRFRAVKQVGSDQVILKQSREETIREGSISKITRKKNPIHQVINDGEGILYEFAIYAEPLVVTGIDLYRPTQEPGRYQVAHYTPSAGGHSFEDNARDANGGKQLAKESIVEVVPGVQVRRSRVKDPKARVLVIESLQEEVRKLYVERGDIDVDVLRTNSEIFRTGEDYYQRLDQKTFLEIVRKGDYDYITGFTNLSFNKEVFDASPHLKGILQFSIGYNNIDLEEARKRGIFVTNAQTPSGSPLTIAMSELNIGLMLDANYLLTDSISQEKIGNKKLEKVLLTAMPYSPQAVSEILWGELLRRSLRLDAMYQFVAEGKYCGCGVGPEATILHDQLGADPEVGVNTPLGIVGMNEVGKQLAEFAKAHGLAKVYYFVPKEKRLSAEEEERLHLTYRPLSEIYEVQKEGGYLIRLPGATSLPEVSHWIVDPEDLWVKSGREEALFEKTLAGQRLSIAGLGRIGLAVATRAVALGMGVLTFEKNPDNIARATQQKVQVQVVDKKAFFEEADVITTLFDLNPETLKWVGKEDLERIRNPKAIVLNTSRGPIVDEEALIAYGKNHPEVQIRVDVLTDESNTNGNTRVGLFELPNARITGHTGSAVVAVRRRMQEIAFENLSAILDGTLPLNPVPPVPVGEVIVRKMLFEAIKSASASEAVWKNVTYDPSSNILTIQGRPYDLKEVRHIYVIGYGKVVAEMAESLHRILGNRITAGVLNVDGYEQKKKYHGKIGKIELYAGRHPSPGLEGPQGTEAMLKLLGQAGPEDMVISLISGGGSSIGALPIVGTPEHMTLEELQTVYEILEGTAINIHEKNIIRKHLDQRTTILRWSEHTKYFVNLLISDVPGDHLPDIASGYTVGDTSTFKDAKSILERHKLWKKIPPSMRNYIDWNIQEGNRVVIRPHDSRLSPERFQSALLVGNRPALEKAAEVAGSFGLKTKIVDRILRASVQEEAKLIMDELIDASSTDTPLVLLWGGETTIDLPPTGAKRGGRNSHMALLMAGYLSLMQVDLPFITFMAATTDGKDGNWDGAGAVVMPETMKRAMEKGINPLDFLKEFDSGTFAEKMGIEIETDEPITNVMDMLAAAIFPKKAADGGGKEFEKAVPTDRIVKDLSVAELYQLAVKGERIRADQFAHEVMNDPTLMKMEAKAGKPLREMKVAQFRQTMAHNFKTAYGSTIYYSNITNRSAANTHHLEIDGFKVDTDQKAADPEYAQKVWDAVQEFLKDKDKELIQVDRSVGQDPNESRHFRLLVSKEYGRLAHELTALHFPPREGASLATPDILTIDLPDFDLSQYGLADKKQPYILRIPSRGISLVLGTDYFGEIKKSALTMNGYLAKQNGDIALHAGSKIVKVRDAKSGEIVTKRIIASGLSGTGKTTTLVGTQGLGLDDSEEASIMKQDDFVEIRFTRDSTTNRIISYKVRGLERGVYYKTERLNPTKEPELFNAAKDPETVLSNVWMNETEKGLVPDYDNVDITANGRGVVVRERITDDPTVDMDGIDVVVWLTRRETIVPPLALLTPSQAAAYWLLGESVITSAADPTRAGQSVREAGFSPFIVGSVSQEANLLMELFETFPEIQVVLANTGRVGAKYGEKASPGEKIDVPDSAALFKALFRGNLETERDPDWGYRVAKETPGYDIQRLEPSQYYSKEGYQRMNEALRQERLAWLERFPGLRPEIIAAIQKPELPTASETYAEDGGAKVSTAVQEILTLDDVTVGGKRVLVRPDLNASVVKGGISLTERITEAAKTIKELSEKSAKVVVMAHQGRPGDADYLESLEQHAAFLSKEMDRPVRYVHDLYGKEAQEAIKTLQDGEILLLKNVRPGEKDKAFIETLEPLFDLFVLDGFSVAHRDQPSVTGFKKIPNVVGRLMQREIEGNSRFLTSAEHPYMELLGGFKISDHLDALEYGLTQGLIDKVLTGGMLGQLLLLIEGYELGEPTREALRTQDVDETRPNGLLGLLPRIKTIYETHKDKFELPIDLAYVDSEGNRQEILVSDLSKSKIPYLIGDNGTETARRYAEILRGAKTVFVKGPQGNYKVPEFRKSSEIVLKNVSASEAFWMTGGGDTDKLIGELKLTPSHRTLGGGAFLEFKAGKTLPGIQRLAESAQQFEKQIHFTKFGQRLEIGDETVLSEIVAYWDTFSPDDPRRQELYEWLQHHESKLAAKALARVGLNWMGVVPKLVKEIRGEIDANSHASARQLHELATKGTYGGLRGAPAPVLTEAQKVWKTSEAEFSEYLSVPQAPVFPTVPSGTTPGVLILDRHGETTWSEAVLSRWAGWHDSKVTEKGRQEAFTSGSRIKVEGLALDIAYSSDLSRAKDTLSEALQAIGQPDVPVVVNRSLRERDYGDMIGWNRNDVEKIFGEAVYKRWRRGYTGDDVRPPGGENLADVLERVRPFLVGRILSDIATGKNVIVSAHGNSLRSILVALREHTGGRTLTDEEVMNLEVPLTTPIVITFDSTLNHRELWVEAEKDPSDVAVFLKEATQDGGVKGVLAEAARTLLQELQEHPEVGSKEKLKTLMDLVRPQELAQKIEERKKVNVQIRNLSLVLLREVLLRENQTRKKPVMSSSRDLYLKPIEARSSGLKTLQEGKLIVVLSISRLLDERLNTALLSDLLDETEGYLFFSPPDDKTDKALYERYRTLMPKLRPRYVSNDLRQLSGTRAAVLLVDLVDQHFFGIDPNNPNKFLSVVPVGKVQKAFVVPLNGPIDFLRELYLGFDLARQVWSLRENLQDLEAATKFLLTEIARGLPKAEHLTATGREELDRAKKIVIEVLVGL